MKLLKVAEGFEQAYKQTCIDRNQHRLLPTAISIAGAEILLLIFQFIRFGPSLFKLDYFYVYTCTTLICLVFSAIFYKYRKKRESKFDMLKIQKLYMVALLIIAIATASLELLYNEHESIVFIAFVFFIATMGHFDLVFINILSGLGWLVLMILSFVTIESPEVMLSLMLNLSFVCLVCGIISFPFYNERIEKFNQKILIEEQNRELLHTNAQLEQLNMQLKETAETDALTGISNRFMFNKNIQTAFEYSITSKEAISVIMIDIDEFKIYNDYFGHLQGDKCLIEVSRAIAQCLKRSGDRVFRYGGEEFIVLLPRADETGASLITNRIIKEVEQMKIPHVVGDGVVTISAGIHSMVPDKNDSYMDLISKADQALYKAKSSGKNKYVVYKEL